MSRRLIELSIPLDEISAQSAREKSIRHGHISTLHRGGSKHSSRRYLPPHQPHPV